MKSEKRETRIGVRLGSVELKKLERLCAAQNLTKSQWIRQAIDKARLK